MMNPNDNPELWPMLLLLFLLAIAVFSAMTATTRADCLKDEAADLQCRLDAQEEITRQRDGQLLTAESKAAKLHEELNSATDKVKTLREENGNLRLQVKAALKDVESLRDIVGDMHRVIDMEAVKLKEKDAVIARQREKIDRLMKIRKK